MELIVNGEKQIIEDSIGLLDFLHSKGLKPELVVIEHNGRIISRVEWSDIILKENDKLEVLRFVGGG